MPELREEMYCSQQICIPPIFPYLLRQYAKAAIRSQPTDLLKWSTAYFRCLSLNIPPPVKPRLEYPIPRDYYGITPGWLRALLYQLANNQTVSFKVLWDRWVGACLQHECLIKILCLGGFTDNTAIPLMRFLALSAAHLTENLTQTMILVCEVLTEEPEGGSAMITIELFLDLYKFLANIDASKPQWLKNIYFTDAALGLYEEEVEKKKKKKKVKEELTAELRSESTTSTTKSEATISKKETISEISCPSVGGDENLPVEEYLKMISGAQQFDEGGDGVDDKEKLLTCGGGREEDSLSQLEPSVKEAEVTDAKKPADETKEKVEAESGQEKPGEDETETKPEENDKALQIDSSEDKPEGAEAKPSASMSEQKSSDEKAADSETMADDDKTTIDDTIEKSSSIDLDKTETLDDNLISQPTIDDYIGMEFDGEGYPSELTDHMAYIQQIDGYGTYEADYLEGEGYEIEPLGPGLPEKAKEIPKGYEEVYVGIIPGIGPIVPEHIVNAVCDFMRNESIDQHGMVMPRNIRHYKCPPLEILEY